MPHVSAGSNSSSGGSAAGGGGGASSSTSSRIRDDPNDCDEVKIFKCAEDEGEGDSDDVMNDDKRDLIRATECDQKGRLSPLSPLSPAFSGGHSSSYSSSKNGHATLRPDHPSSIFGKLEGVAHPSPLNMGYLMPYPYPNGSHLSSMAEKMRLGAGSLPFFCNGVEGLTQPPPAHMGYHGLSRSAMYPFGVQYPYSGLPEVSQVASWHAQSMYPISNAGSPGGSAGFRNYPPTLSIPPTSIPSDFYRFSPGGLLQGPGLGGHPGLGHHLVGTPSKHDPHSSHLDHNHSYRMDRNEYRPCNDDGNRDNLVEAGYTEPSLSVPGPVPVPLPPSYPTYGPEYNFTYPFASRAGSVYSEPTESVPVPRQPCHAYAPEYLRNLTSFIAQGRRRYSKPETCKMVSTAYLPYASSLIEAQKDLMEQNRAQHHYSYACTEFGESMPPTPSCPRPYAWVSDDEDVEIEIDEPKGPIRTVREGEAGLVCEVKLEVESPTKKMDFGSSIWGSEECNKFKDGSCLPSPSLLGKNKLKRSYPRVWSSLSDQKSSDTHGSKNASDSGQSSNSQNEKKKPHIKKPLNAFMLYMKEMRAKVVAECTLKESAAINQILGRRWHSLNREEQSKYYELARQERQVHMQMYPGWSARDNYGYGAKKKKRKKEKSSDGGREEQAKYYELARRERQLHMQMYPNWSSAQNRTHHEKKRKKKQDQKFDGGNSMKKCRARYGLDQQNQWCKPCRRKKKCIRYLEEQNNGVGSVASINSPDDNLGSAGSAGEPLSPDSKGGDSDMERSSDMGMSSPSFSLTSPGMSMNSPGMSLPSPAMTSPSGVLASPSSLASPAVSLPSLQSPMTPSLVDDRHPISSVSSSTSSVSFTTTSTTTNHQNNTSTSTSTLSAQNNIQNSSRNQSNNSPSSSSYNNNTKLSSNNQANHLNHHQQQHHHQNNNIHHPQFGFGLGHLFGSGGSPNGAGGGMAIPGLPFPFPLGGLKPLRNPVGANPHDINNPLSVNQLTGQFNSSSSSSASSLSSERSSSASSHKSMSMSHNSNSNHNSNHNNNHHHHHNNRPERSRSRDRREVAMAMDTRESPDVVSSKKSSSQENNNKGGAGPVPVIGVS